VEYETYFDYPFAGRRRMHVHYLPERSDTGTITGIVATLIDVTDQIESENALRLQAMLIDLSVEPILVWKPDGGILEWNKGAEKLYGYTREEAIGRVTHDLLGTRFSRGFDEYFAALNRDGEWSGELTHRTKSGREAVVETRQQILETPAGKVVLETNRDVTEKKYEERRLILLADVGEIIRVTPNDLDLLYRVACAVGSHFEAQRCLFNEINIEADLEIVHKDYTDGVESVTGEHRISDYSSETSADMAAGKTVVNHDSKTDPRTSERYSDVYEPVGERSYVAVPLMRDGKWVASLWISCDRPHDWAKGDVRLLEMIAERAWLAVEKARNEQAMRQSEERFSRFMQHLPGLAWIKDVDGRYVFANDAAFGAFGRSADDLYGHTDKEVFPPATAEVFIQNDSRVLQQREGIQDIEPLEHPDGTLRHSVVNKFPILNERGEPTLVGGMAIDITDQRRAEIALREKEAELQKLADTTPIVLVRCGRDLTYKFINKAGAALFNKTPAEMVGMSIRDAMGEEAFGRIEAQIRKVLAGETVEYDVELPYPTGTHWMRVNYVPETDASDEVTGWIASITDITEVRNANALVQRDLADMTTLRDVGAVSAAASERQTVYDAILDAAVSLMKADFGSFQRFDSDRQALQLLSIKNFDERAADHWRWLSARDNTPCGMALSEGKRKLIPDIESEPRLAGTHTLDELRDAGVRSAQSTPLFSRDGDIVGMVSTHWRVPHRPTERDLGFLDLLARQAADVLEQKLDEDRLRESEERFRIAQQAGGVGIWDWNIIEGRTYWSETTWDFYGEIPGSADPNDEFWTTHIHPEDRDRVKRNLLGSVASRSRSYKDEFRILRRDGTILWIESSASITRDNEGRATRIFGVNIDITERRIAEDRVRASAQQLRLVTDAMPALISYIDKNGRYRFANQTYHDWFGIAPEEVVGKRVSEVFGDTAYGILKPHIAAAMRGEDVAFETEIRYRTGPIRYVHISYTPDIDTNGTVRGYFALTTDLTELKRSEEMLRSTEQKVGLMMETFTDYAIMSLDAKGFIDSWNVGAKLIFGYDESEIVGKPGDVLFLPEDIANGVPEGEMRTAREKGRALDERWHMRKDGTRFFASGVMMPLYLGARLTGYAKIASDLTERQRQKEELERAHSELELRVAERTRELAESNRALIEEAKARTAAEEQRIHLLHRLVNSQELERRRIARDIHDQLGQRLTGLRLKIESLNSLVGEYPEIAARVKRLQEISEGLDAEVSFLAWELRPTVLDDLGLVDALRTFVHEWSRHTEISAGFQSIKVGKERFDNEVETHLYRITQEALNNINKHAKAKNVTVMLEKRKKELILIVEDDGRGFDTTKLERPRKSGRGLGLIGMQERANLIGGELDIESSENGTTIYVRVPVFES
ncbi:MAG TPA: PAS domain S-box protein, partial [Pyrinomonadaceae bacterium]|nr:PAS domain S-box protein [Pyrinomonadaceae bacterium]